MGKLTHFKNLPEENRSRIPAQLNNGNPIFKLLLANQIVLYNCKPVELELCCNKASYMSKELYGF